MVRRSDQDDTLSVHDGGMDWHRAAAFPQLYEELMVPWLFAPFTDDVLDACDLENSSRLLDVASGTGVLARRALARAPHLDVTSVDLNEAMLAEAERAAPALPIARIRADVARMPFPDGAFDVVACQQGLQFFPDRPAALHEMRRVLRPGGRLAVATWCELGEQPAYAAIVGALRELGGEAAAGAGAAPYALGDGGLLGRLLAEAGFREIAVGQLERRLRFPSGDDLVRAYLEGTPVAVPLGELDATTRDALFAAARGAVEPFCIDGAAVFPMRTNLASAVAP